MQNICLELFRKEEREASIAGRRVNSHPELRQERQVRVAGGGDVPYRKPRKRKRRKEQAR